MGPETAMGWYVVVHLLIAYLNARRAAIWSGCSPESSAVAGVVYAFSGMVLFLYCNPPFLVGAAWLPLVLGVLLNPESLRQKFRVSVAACALALMVLGGDPQTALHALLVAGGFVLLRSIARQRLPAPSSISPLLLSPLIAAALTAPQLGASLHWSWRSERVAGEKNGVWWESPSRGSLRDHAFDYSTPPWRLTELLTPAASGSLFPKNHRLATLSSAEVRVWTPTLFAGSLALVAGLCRLIRLRRDGIDRWIVVAAVGLGCSFGSFGLIWCLQSLLGWPPRLFGAIGGPYWLLYEVLPGYDAFRYPSKWLPVFALALAVVTGRWIDGISREPRESIGSGDSNGTDLQEVDRRLTKRIACSLALLLAAALVGVICLRLSDRPLQWLSLAKVPLPVDRFWGPLQVDGALLELACSICLSLATLVAIIWLVHRLGAAPQPPKTRTKRWQAIAAPSSISSALLLVTTVELTLVATQLLAIVPAQAEKALLREVADDIAAKEQYEKPQRTAVRWLRTQVDGGWPEVWKQRPSRTRLIDVETSQRIARFGRWHLSRGEAVFNNMTSIRSLELARFWRALRRFTRDMPPRERGMFWRELKLRFGIDGVLRTTDQARLTDHESVTHALVDIHRELARPLSRPYLSAQWKSVQQRVSTESWLERFDTLKVQGTNAAPWVLTRDPALIPSPPTQQEESVTGSVDIVRENAEQLVLEVEADQPSLLVRRVYQDGNWKVLMVDANEENPRAARVHQVDFLCQGVFIPAGRWTIEFRYQPMWLLPLIAIAVVAWIGLAVWWIAGQEGLRPNATKRC